MKKIFLKILIGIALGTLVFHPFASTVVWMQFNEHIPFKYHEWVFSHTYQSHDFLTRIKADLAYMAFGIIMVFVISKIMDAYQQKKATIDVLTNELGTNLKSLIQNGESDNLEFKSSLRWDLKLNEPNKVLEKVVTKTIAGFLNGNGGTLLIGVNDNGEVLGIEQDYNTLRKKNRDGFELAIRDLVSTKIGNDLSSNVKVVFHNIENKDICRIIMNNSNRPVYVKDNQKSYFYLRSGASTRELNIEEAVNYVASHYS